MMNATRNLKGKKAIVPLINRVIPIIFDEYVDVEFGTGALKITPAHDINDYILADKHGLESIDILNDDGTLSQEAELYIGKDRFDVREEIAVDLKAKGYLVKTEEYQNKVGFSERTNAVIMAQTDKWVASLSRWRLLLDIQSERLFAIKRALYMLIHQMLK